MNTKLDILKQTEDYVREALSSDASGHDWYHIERVKNNTELLLEGEEADKFVVLMAALLHDVGDRKVLGTAEDDYSIAEDFMSSQGVESDDLNKIIFIIKNMSFSKSLENGEITRTIELDLVQDADRLDAMGALGIARAFAYGGSAGRALYDPGYTPEDFSDTKKYREAKSSSLHHFPDKLFKLKDLSNTKTGKKIAAKRLDTMQEFYDQFLREWEGEC